MLGIRRRDFISLLGGAAWPRAVSAQRAALPLVGFIEVLRMQICVAARGGWSQADPKRVFGRVTRCKRWNRTRGLAA
jgi:hypothetical protein